MSKKYENTINCPICGEEIFYRPHEETHIWKCRFCPFVGFEYYRHKDIEAITASLRGGE